MTVGIEAAAVASLGGWLLLVPLGLASTVSVGAALWFLRRSRGRRLLPADRNGSDPSVR